MSKLILGNLDLFANKQDKNIYFTNVTANSWTSSTEYPDYIYQCDIACPGVTDQMYPEVIFDITEANSGDYAPVCDTLENAIRIYSKVNNTIIIPTIKISK